MFSFPFLQPTAMFLRDSKERCKGLTKNGLLSGGKILYNAPFSRILKVHLESG